MEFKNGLYEKIISNEKNIDNLFQLRADCKSQWEKEVKEVKEQVEKIQRDFDKLTDRVEKKLNMLLGLVLSSMAGIIIHLVIEYIKKKGI